MENKQYLPINDPLDAYFEEFEKKLEKIKNPKYSKLIDLTTFKPKKNAFFLNNAQYAEFKKVKDAYDIDRKKYEVNLELYEKNGKNGSSPKPPTKPVVVLPNGKNHTIGRELDPLHIKDEVIKSFKRDYKKALPIIEEYNAIKNMSYLELKKRVIANSPSSSVKQLIRDNELLTMTKEQIANDVLYDYSGLADNVHDAAKGHWANWNRNLRTGVTHGLTAGQTFGRVHCDGANGVFAKMLCNFKDEAVAVIVGFKCRQNGRQLASEGYVDNSADNL